MVNIQPLKAFLSQTRKAVILMHYKPDADALGSSLGMAGYLKKKGHDVTVIAPSDYPAFLEWMPGNEAVLVNTKETEAKAVATINNAEIIFCLDFSSLSRINNLGDVVKNAKGTKVLIDHHLEPEKFADFEQWDVTAASTAELIYKTIDELGDTDLIDAEIASCLYAGLMTDTGGFRHSNTTHKVFEVAGKLVAHGANPHDIAKFIYDNNSLERLRLMGYVFSKKLVVLPEFKTAYITLTRDELRNFESQTGDTEGMVNYGLSIKGIILSVMIYERKDGSIKLSFRSQEDFSVNEMARKHFEGGGHRNASGGQSDESLDKTLQRFLNILPEYKQQLGIH